MKIDKQFIKKMLVRYKDYKDWLDIYEEKCEMNMGMRYSPTPHSVTNNFHSKTESDVLIREEDREEYDTKQGYVAIVDKILGTLTDPERFIVEHKFNLINNSYYNQFQPGEIKDTDIYGCDSFPYEEGKYYSIKKRAYEKIGELLRILQLEKK